MPIRSRSKIAGAIAALLLGLTFTHWVTVTRLPGGLKENAIKGRPQQQERNSDPISATTPSLTLTQDRATSPYNPDCAHPQKEIEAFYCELRHIALRVEDAVALAGKTNWSGWAQSGAAIMAVLIAGWAAIEAGRAGRAAVTATKVAQASLRHAARNNRLQSRISDASAKAAMRTADAAAQVVRGLQRPYLFIEIEDTSNLCHAVDNSTFNPPRKPRLCYSVVNHGQLPAIMRSFSISLRDGPPFPLYCTTTAADKSYAVVPPGERLKRPKIAPAGLYWLEVLNSKSADGYGGENATNLILHAMIEYDDPSGAHHSDSVCMRATEGARYFCIDSSVEEYNWHESHYPGQAKA